MNKSYFYLDMKTHENAPANDPNAQVDFCWDAEYIQMAYRFPGAATKDAQLLDLMSSILSNGSAGLMDNNLVLKQKVLGCSAGSWARGPCRARRAGNR